MTDATGVPTNPDLIPTYNTSVDAPSGLGFNTAMAQLQAIITNLKAGTLASGKLAMASLAATGVASATTFLRGDGAWAAPGGAGMVAGANIGAANTDLAAPTLPLTYITASTGGGTLRSIGAGVSSGARISLKNTSASFITLKHALAGGTGAQLSIINAGDKYLAPGQSNDFIYDGTNWQEVGRPGKELICDSVLGGAAASFDTNTILGGNIPAVYRHLELSVSENCNLNSSLQLRFNNDSGANYDRESYQALSGAGAASELFGDASVAMGIAAVGANYFGSLFALIGDYNGGHYKSVTAIHHAAQTGPGNVSQGMYGGSWRNAAAINRIQLIAGGNNFQTGSRFTLHGVT